MSRRADSLASRSPWRCCRTWPETTPSDGSPSRPTLAFRLFRSDVCCIFIRENLDTDIAVSDLAACIGVSSAHFSRIFRTSFGMSPYRFVMRERVAKAKAMLEESRWSIGEIAIELGFSKPQSLHEDLSSADRRDSKSVSRGSVDTALPAFCSPWGKCLP